MPNSAASSQVYSSGSFAVAREGHQTFPTGLDQKIELTVVNALDALVVDHALVIVFHGVEGRERGQALGGDIEQEAP